MAEHVIYVEAHAVPSAPSAPESLPLNVSSTGPAVHNNSFHSDISSTINEAGAFEYLQAHKWPYGLQRTSVDQMKKIAFRFIICDDSGSMMASDGHKLMTASNGVQKFVACTRWQELTEGLKFHAGLAKAAAAPTEFRLLNGSPPIRIGIPDEGDVARFNLLRSKLDQSPSGGTPLCRHIREVIAEIRLMEPQLRATGQKACVIIATDGESSDGDIITAMQPLRNLPVWVVVRLCTDEDRIVEYWNNIDSQLEVDMDVLDDLRGEAEEVGQNNPWLTYGEPMHRLREFGVLIKEIDMLDSNKLTLDQIRKFCTIIYGGTDESYPHPELDFAGFIAAVEKENRRSAKVWDPVSARAADWVNVRQLRSMNPKGGCAVM